MPSYFMAAMIFLIYFKLNKNFFNTKYVKDEIIVQSN